MSKRDDILNQLIRHKFMSPTKLESLNDMPNSSIRARIAELRKIGYDIRYERTPAKRYLLFQKHPLTDYLEKNNLFNIPISINKLSKELNLPEEEIKTSISKLFDSYEVYQLSSDAVVIKKMRGIDKND